MFKYIFGFSDNGIALKVTLNEEIGRLKLEMKKHIDKETNITMNKRLTDVHEYLNSLNETKDNDKVLLKILQIQKLSRELT